MKRLLAVTATLFFLGCGGADVPEVGDVSGTVTIDGKPGANIRVSFIPVAGGRSSSGTTDESGHYVLQYSPDAMGALIGKHQAMIAPPEPSADIDSSKPKNAPLVDKSIPKTYTDMKKDVEVKPGDNTINLTYPLDAV